MSHMVKSCQCPPLVCDFATIIDVPFDYRKMTRDVDNLFALGSHLSDSLLKSYDKIDDAGDGTALNSAVFNAHYQLKSLNGLMSRETRTLEDEWADAIWLLLDSLRLTALDLAARVQAAKNSQTSHARRQDWVLSPRDSKSPRS